MTLAWLIGSKLGRAVLATLAIALVAGMFYMSAYHAGQSDLLREQNELSLEAWEKHNEIQTDTDRLSDHDLCIKLGGLPDDCAQ